MCIVHTHFITQQTFYLNGKANRRIDVFPDLLLKVEHDSFFNYDLLLQPNKVTFRVEGAHKRGMSISPEKVNVSIMVQSILFIHIQTHRKSLMLNGTYSVNQETTSQDTLSPR